MIQNWIVVILFEFSLFGCGTHEKDLDSRPDEDIPYWVPTKDSDCPDEDDAPVELCDLDGIFQ